MLGFMPQRQDGVLARGLRQPIRLGIDRFPPPCAGIGGGSLIPAQVAFQCSRPGPGSHADAVPDPMSMGQV
jgi:hypothetical protein